MLLSQWLTLIGPWPFIVPCLGCANIFAMIRSSKSWDPGNLTYWLLRSAPLAPVSPAGSSILGFASLSLKILMRRLPQSRVPGVLLHRDASLGQAYLMHSLGIQTAMK